MKTQGEHIRTLRRRVDFLKTRDHKNSYDQAELGALEWALVNLPPAQRTWVGLTDGEVDKMILLMGFPPDWITENAIVKNIVRNLEAKLKEKNT